LVQALLKVRSLALRDTTISDPAKAAYILRKGFRQNLPFDIARLIDTGRILERRETDDDDNPVPMRSTPYTMYARCKGGDGSSPHGITY
jgi:hypothetical protein